MTEKELLKNYPLLNLSELKLPKLSIMNLLGSDNFEDDRAFLMEFMDDSSDNDDDEFFWEMLRCVKFISDKNSVAYTTRDKIISLSYPATRVAPDDKEKWQRWYFIYCHECLHQLWETFSVEDEIIKKHGQCDHKILNIASDCVINDYLSSIAKSHKKRPIGIIYPETIKEKFGVDYDRNTDTQYSLYLKLLQVSQEKQKEWEEFIEKYEKDDNQEGYPGNDPQKGPGGKKEGYPGNDPQKGPGGKKEGPGGDPGGDKEGPGGDPGINPQRVPGGDKNGPGGDPGNDPQNGPGGGESGKGAGTDEGDLFDRDLIDEVRDHAEKTIKKFTNSITGSISEFTKKCKICKKLNPGGMIINAKKGSTAWNKQLDSICHAYVRQKLNNRKLYKDTYTRVRRGERAFTPSDLRNGRLITPGREEKRQQIGFTVALYVDTSGSMGDCISKVFKCAYKIGDSIKDTFGKDKNVDKDKISLKSYIFTTNMREIPWGKTCNAGGGTYDFDQLLKDVNDRGKTAFLNIILTDGQFGSVNTDEIVKVIDKMEGLFVMVTNNAPGTFDQVVTAVKKKCGPKLQVIYTDANFTIE